MGVFQIVQMASNRAKHHIAFQVSITEKVVCIIERSIRAWYILVSESVRKSKIIRVSKIKNSICGH